MNFVRYCQVLNLTLIAAFFLFGGIVLHYSIGSQWTDRQCLVLNQKIINAIGCSEGQYSGGGPCYAAQWNISALDKNNITINYIMTSGSNSDLRKIRVTLNTYQIGFNYTCYLQAGTNQYVPMFVWSLSSYLKVDDHLIIGSVLVSLAFLLVLFNTISCIVLREKSHDEEEILLT